MYVIFGILLFLCIVFLCLQLHRRNHMVCKVMQMDTCEKVCLLNKLFEPFGFCYLEKQDLVSSRTDAWQKQFGYCSLFDQTALHFGMAFDCEPIYFYYEKKTYLIELWKGQYGINMGAEAGIYYVNGILPPEQFADAHFKAVPQECMLPIQLTLCYKGQKMFDTKQCHWWLTGFCMGKYCEPEDLTLWISITCASHQMLYRFVESLLHIGYQYCDLLTRDLTISFAFCRSHNRPPRCRHPRRVAWCQWKNRLCVKLFIFFTKPFTCTLDRLLYLYFFLPFAFRRILLCRKNRRQKFKKKWAVHCHEL